MAAQLRGPAAAGSQGGLGGTGAAGGPRCGGMAGSVLRQSAVLGH